MPTEPTTPASSKVMVWAGYAISALVIGMMVFSAVVKLGGLFDVGKEFNRLGYSENVIRGIGIVEITCALIYAVPQTAVLGAILLTGYLGGATATHVRIGDPFIPPVIGGMLAWLGLYLRCRRIRELIPLRK